jgi:hypothetical protein
MMKRAIAVTVLLGILAGSAFSQAKPGGVARQLSLGGALYGPNTVLNPFVYSDPAWVLVNPAYQSKYRDYIWLNVAGGGVTGANGAENTSSSQFGGLNLGFGGFTVGLLMNYDPSYANALGGTGGLLANYINIARPGRANPAIVAQPVGAPPPVDAFEAIGSFKVNGFMVGVGLSYGWTNKDATSSTATTSTEGKIRTNVFGVRGGVLWDLGSGNSLDAAVAFRLANATDSYTLTAAPPAVAGTSEYTASSTDLGINVRGHVRMSNRVSLIPYGAFRTISADPKEESILSNQTASPYTLSRGVLAYGLGVGAEYTTRTFYMAGGVSFTASSTKDEEENRAGAATGSITTKNSFTGFPVFNLGGEWWFTDWLAGRMGYYRSLGTTSREFDQSITQTSQEGNLFQPSSIVGISGYGPIPDNSLVTLGLGLRFEGFAMDATVSEEALRRGLGLLGSGDSINTFGYITLSYSFE